MPRIDDYRQARTLSAEQLSGDPLEAIARRSGFETDDGEALRVPFLDRTYRIEYPDFRFIDKEHPEQEIPLQEQVLILHYLEADAPVELSGRWIAYREIPGAGFYFGAFVQRAISPLKNVFGHRVDDLARPARVLGGTKIEDGDAGFEFFLFPHLPLRLIVWSGDEEFAPEASILFDESAGSLLSPEDAAWAASLLVYRLIGLAKSQRTSGG